MSKFLIVAFAIVIITTATAYAQRCTTTTCTTIGNITTCTCY